MNLQVNLWVGAIIRQRRNERTGKRLVSRKEGIQAKARDNEHSRMLRESNSGFILPVWSQGSRKLTGMHYIYFWNLLNQ